MSVEEVPISREKPSFYDKMVASMTQNKVLEEGSHF